MKKAILLFTLLCIPLAAWSYSFTVSGIYYNITSSTSPYTVEVTYASTSYNSYANSQTIPSTIQNGYITYSVTSIGNHAFFNCANLTSVTIPSSVNSIGSSAFELCTHLTSITIPSSVTSIGSLAFSGCNGLTSITIPSSVTSISNAAFYGCGLINVDAANNNYSSLNGILYNKTQTQIINCPTSKTGSFIIPSSVTAIGDSAFYYCTGLTSITIPSSVTSIGSYAFSGCNSLSSIVIPSLVTSIGNYTFYFNSSLTSITIPSSVTSIGNYAFNSCGSLKSISIPSSVNSIGSYAFENCVGLTSITIPVTSIGIYAFYNCTRLTSVTIPASVTSIGSSAFRNCTAITSIYAYPTKPVNLTKSTDAFQGVNRNYCTLFVPYSSLSLYKADQQWRGIAAGILYIPLTVSITKITNLSRTNVNIESEVKADGGQTILSRGICWGTTAQPTISTNKTLDGTGLGVFTSSITGLSTSTTYHARAYVTSSTETSYGSDLAFTTLAATTPSLTTKTATSITGTTATSGGSITDDGDATITACGVCWSTIANPTISNSKTFARTDTSSFTSSITGLLPNTTYHIRAFATNSVGTSYGPDLAFTTQVLTIPELTTTTASSITGTTATSGGTILNIGGSNLVVWSCGVCWSTTVNPTISDSKSLSSTWYDTATSFTSFMTGLLPNTTYHIRAYATNSIGTAYGSDLTFKTLNNTALNDNSVELFNVYPNPTNGAFTLNMELSTANNSTVCLLNMLGQKVYESKLVSEKSTLNLSTYNFKGIYFLQLQNEKGILIGERKIVFK